MAKNFQLPLFLYSRNAAADMTALLTKHRDGLKGGVVSDTILISFFVTIFFQRCAHSMEVRTQKTSCHSITSLELMVVR